MNLLQLTVNEINITAQSKIFVHQTGEPDNKTSFMSLKMRMYNNLLYRFSLF